MRFSTTLKVCFLMNVSLQELQSCYGCKEQIGDIKMDEEQLNKEQMDSIDDIISDLEGILESPTYSHMEQAIKDLINELLEIKL